LSFQDELRALLRKHNLEWDERYIWDCWLIERVQPLRG